jgi:UDP-glucose 4-epimerase
MMHVESVADAYAGKRVLVTGGAGSIGGRLARRLADLETEQVILLDNLSSSYEWNVARAPKIKFIKGDILNEEALRFAFNAKPDIVFHLAAHFANQNSVDYPETDLMVNGLGILKVLQYAHLADIGRFVYSSSGCGVYGVCSTMPFEEQDVSTSLHSPYQVTKLLGELYTNYFYNLYGLPVVNARLFNVYGPGEVPGKYRNVIPNFFYWSMRGQALPITGDGTETRDWTFVGDAINGLLAMGVRHEAVGEAINLGSGKEHRVIDMARIVNGLTGNTAGIQHVQSRDWDAKPRLLSSIDKARKLIDYQPSVAFEEGLRKVHEWFVENWDDIVRSADF